MKNKNIILLAVAAVLLAGMAAALIWLQKQPASDEEVAEAEPVIYITGSEKTLAPLRIEVQNEYGGYVLYDRQPGTEEHEWMIEGLEQLSLDKYGMMSVVNNSCMMTAKSVVVDEADNQELADFGFKRPRAFVTVKDPEKTVVLLIGNDAPGGEGVYVSHINGRTVYLVASSAVERVLYPKLVFVNAAVTAGDSQSTVFKRLTLSGENYPEPIVIEETPEDAVSAGGITMNSHRIMSPVNAGLDSQNGLAPLNGVFGLTADEVVAVQNDTETLRKYGLENPAAVVKVETDDEEAGSFTLRVSDPDANGNVCLIKDGSPVIYRLSADYLPWLGLSLFDIREKLAILPFIDNVSGVRVITPEKTYTFSLSGEGDNFSVTLDGAPVKEAVDSNGKTIDGVANFRQFYQVLIFARYDEETQDAPTEDAQPLLSIEYSYRDGSPADTVSLYAGPPRRAFISLNGGKAYLTQTTYIDRVLAEAQNIAQGIAVKA